MRIGWDASRVTFAFPADRIAQALSLVDAPGDDLHEGETAWSVGIAEGDLKPIAEDDTAGTLAWGAPFVVASVLAGAAEPGEVICAQTLGALRSGELLAAGTRVARDGTLRVRGVLLDRHRPWRKQAVEQLFKMRVAPLVGRRPLAPAAVARGTLLLLRADPGAGGTRYLTEVSSRTRSLVIAPSGSGFEPLGALRRAFARSITRELDPLLLELSGALEALVGGDGVSHDVAAQLVGAFLWPRAEGQAPGILLIDDAANIDSATLDVCATAAHMQNASFGVVARLDRETALPAALAILPQAGEIALEALAGEDAESLAAGCTNDALDPLARRRWARLGARIPLGVVESVAFGIVTGDLRWEGERASPRHRVSGRGKVRTPADWILLRARDENADCRTVLCLIALLGGEAKVTRLARVLEKTDHALDVEMVLEDLIRGRWLVDTQEDWVALPSRTHREALSGLLEEDARRAMHAAACDLLEEEEGAFGRIETAWHAAESGDEARASRILLAGARATAHAHLDASTAQLVGLAVTIDPSSKDAAQEVMDAIAARASSLPPPAASREMVRQNASGPHELPSSSGWEAADIAEAAFGTAVATLTASAAPSEPLRPPTHSEMPPSSLVPFDAAAVHDSEPPTIAREQESQEPGAASGTNIAARLGELAKEALLGADNEQLERWVEGLTAAGESSRFTERLRALSRIGRGDFVDALRVLRRTRASLDPKDHTLRCQTSLALGVALSSAGRLQDALLEGMDALAHARHGENERGAKACLAFLSKLYATAGRPEEERAQLR